MAKSPEEMLVSMIANLPEKTGKSLQEWLEITATFEGEKHGLLVKFLKSEHGKTHGFANLVAHKHFEQTRPQETQGPVTLQYSGAKAGLKPIYDALIKVVHGFGDDVKLAPKKAYVSLRRNKQFALIQPSTKTRLDVGIKFKREPEGRLEASGSFNAMCSHRVRLSDLAGVDEQLIAWLREAYEQA